MSDKPDLPPLPEWVEKMLPGYTEGSPRPGLPRPDQVAEASGTTPPANQPQLTPVKSSNIEAAGHDGTSLWIKFLNGTLYRYPTVGADLHQGMLAAPSVGSYFHRHIRSAHKGERVT